MTKGNTESRGGQGRKRDRRNDPKPGSPGFPRKNDIYGLVPPLKAGEQLFLRQVLDKLPSQKGTLETWCSEKRFAREMNCTERTIKNYVKACKNLGVIKVRRDFQGGKFASNVYSFNYPWPPELVEKLEKLQKSRPSQTTQQSDQGKFLTAPTAPGEKLDIDQGKKTTAQGENSSPNYNHLTLTNSYSSQKNKKKRGMDNSQSELSSPPVGPVSGEEDAVEQEAFHPQDSEKGGVPLAGSTRLEWEEDADPSTYDLLRVYKSRFDLDRPLADASLEADVESIAENFLAVNWDPNANPPGFGATLRIKRAVRDGRISEAYRPENFGEFEPKRKEEKIRCGHEVREYIDERIKKFYPDGGIRQTKRWKYQTFDHAWQWRKGIPLSRDRCERDWETDWQLQIVTLVLYLAALSSDSGRL